MSAQMVNRSSWVLSAAAKALLLDLFIFIAPMTRRILVRHGFVPTIVSVNSER